MSTTTSHQAARCPHSDEVHETCADGVFCAQCDEGVCPDCRRLWRETGNVDPETGDFEIGPACDCANPVVLPYKSR